MQRFESAIQSLTTEPDGIPKLRLSLPPGVSLLAGQTLSGFRIGDHAPYRHTLYPIRIEEGNWTAHRLPDPTWVPGDTLNLLGPVGAGFKASARSKRWLLLTMGTQAAQFDPLIEEGLRTGGEISIWVSDGIASPPPQVEVLAEPAPALDWAEYVAGSCSWERLPELIRILDPIQGARRSEIEIHIVRPMPCGLGVCGACAVATTSGHSYPCVAGAVFRLSELYASA